jgi:hypothetical protein
MSCRPLLAVACALCVLSASAFVQAQGPDQPAAGDTKSAAEAGDGVPVGPLVKPGTLQPADNGATATNGKAPPTPSAGNGASAETKTGPEGPPSTNGKATPPPPPNGQGKAKNGPAMAKTGLDLVTLYVTCAVLVTLGAALVVLARRSRVRGSA